VSSRLESAKETSRKKAQKAQNTSRNLSVLFVPFCGIPLLPEFVRDLFHYWPTIKISIKNDSKTLIFTPISTGIQVVLDPPDTSRFARLTNGTKADGASDFPILRSTN
jgi:hypothetical protein